MLGGRSNPASLGAINTGTREVFHHSYLHWPGILEAAAMVTSAGWDVPSVSMDTGDRQERLVFSARGQDVRLDQADGAARIQNGPERFSVNLYLRFRGPSGKVMVHDAACQPGSSRRCWRLRWHGLIPRGGGRPALVSGCPPACVVAHPPGKRWRSLPSVPLLGRIRQFYGPHELERRGRISHADRLSMGAGKSPEETVDDHALRYLGGRGDSVQQQ